MPISLVVTKRYEGQRVTSWVKARYSNQQGSKSGQNPCRVQPTKNAGNLSASRQCLWVQTTAAVSTVWNSASVSESELQATDKTVWCVAQPTNKVTVVESDTKSFLALGGLRRKQVMRHFTNDGTVRCQNGSSNILIPFREQLRSTRIVV